MNSRLLVVAVASVLVLGSLSIATEAQPMLPSTQPAAPAPNLERTMHAMDKLTEIIEKQLDHKAMDELTLEAVSRLQAFTGIAKTALPDEVGELTGEEKQKAIAAYRLRLVKLLRTELALEEAILSGDRPAAHRALEALGAQRKEGHEAYGVGVPAR